MPYSVLTILFLATCVRSAFGFGEALIAVPLLVVVKVFCDHFESLTHVGNFLAAAHAPVNDENGEDEAD